MWQRNRKTILAIAAMVGLLLVIVIGAPRSKNIDSGSTYTGSPDGYGAWFAQLPQQKPGLVVQRWQRTQEEFLGETSPKRGRPDDGRGRNPSTGAGSSGAGKAQNSGSPKTGTFLQVLPDTDYFPSGFLLDSGVSAKEAWISAGNTWIVLGVRQPVTESSYTSVHPFEGRNVKIQTSRRLPTSALTAVSPAIKSPQPPTPSSAPPPKKSILADNFGSIVWSEPVGKGRIIYAVTPHLAANAYQSSPGNFALLNQMVGDGPLWVDEYLHGHRDVEAEREVGEKGDVWDYLQRTGWLAALLQAGVIALVAIWGLNRRFGLALSLPEPQIDNSQAYIQAMSEVLLKAERSEFVWDLVGQRERIEIQQALGLGHHPLPTAQVVQTWQAQTGLPSRDLLMVLEPPFLGRRASEPELLTWLERLKAVRAALPLQS
jgi:hypothetical protein